MTAKWPVHDEEEIEAVAAVLRSGLTNYWSGPHGRAFETEFAAYTSARHALSVTNGTAALELALHGLGFRDGAEVIVPCRTFVATASAVVTNGLTPVLADIDAVSMNVTVDTLEARRTAKTIAVIVVHYAGLPCDMVAICDWAAKHGLYVIEDCAHAHGATIDGRHVGTFGEVGCFSFCVGKIMSLGGEGGMVITDNSVLYRRMTRRRDHGRFQMVGQPGDWQFRYTVEEAGSNLRMTEMQSAIGRLQLKKLDGWVTRRREIARFYDAHLKQAVSAPGHAFYMYLMRVPAHLRSKILEQTYEVGVRWGGCSDIGYETAFERMRTDCPGAEVAGAGRVSLPIYPTMSDDDVARIVDVMGRYV